MNHLSSGKKTTRATTQRSFQHPHLHSYVSLSLQDHHCNSREYSSSSSRWTAFFFFMPTEEQIILSSSPLREPLLPAHESSSSYWVQFGRDPSDTSLGLEDAMRSWYDQQGSFEPANNDNEEEIMMYHSDRPCLPWYRNPLQIMAMISNFSTSYNVANIALVLPILKIVLRDHHPVSAEDEVSVYSIYIYIYMHCAKNHRMQATTCLTRQHHLFHHSPCSRRLYWPEWWRVN